MIGEVSADLCLPKLMSVIVDCGITKSVAVEKSPLARTVMRLVFGEGSYSSMQIIITFGILMLLIVLVACRLDIELHTTYIRDAACIAFIANETISIIENAGLMGVPIPKAIVKAIELLKSKDEEENNK
jgi:phage-related holin